MTENRRSKNVSDIDRPIKKSVEGRKKGRKPQGVSEKRSRNTGTHGRYKLRVNIHSYTI